MLLAQIPGLRGGCGHLRAALAHFALEHPRTAKHVRRVRATTREGHALLRAVGLLPRRPRDRPGAPDQPRQGRRSYNGALLSADLKLSGQAARLINKVAGEQAVSAGAPLGTAESRVTSSTETRQRLGESERAADGPPVPLPAGTSRPAPHGLPRRELHASRERAALAPHFTNLDRPVFALVNLPETVKGALFARYSRYQGTLRRLFLDEFAAAEAGARRLRRRGGRARGASSTSASSSATATTRSRSWAARTSPASGSRT